MTDIKTGWKGKGPTQCELTEAQAQVYPRWQAL